MSRYYILEGVIPQLMDYKEVIRDENECRHKVNGICFNNRRIKELGKKCYRRCGEWERDD